MKPEKIEASTKKARRTTKKSGRAAKEKPVTQNKEARRGKNKVVVLSPIQL